MLIAYHRANTFRAYKICPNLLKLAKAPASEYARRACRGCEHKYGRYALLDSELKSSFEINRVYRIAIGSGFTPKWQNPIQAPRDAVEATREIEINGTKVKFTNSDVKWPAGVVSYSHRVSTSSGIGIIRLQSDRRESPCPLSIGVNSLIVCILRHGEYLKRSTQTTRSVVLRNLSFVYFANHFPLDCCGSFFDVQGRGIFLGGLLPEPAGGTRRMNWSEIVHEAKKYRREIDAADAQQRGCNLGLTIGTDTVKGVRCMS